MNRSTLNKIKQAIRLNLEDKTGQIIESYGTYLSRKDIILLVRFMIRYQTYSAHIVRYIFCISPHRHELSSPHIKSSIYIMLRYAGREGRMDLFEILLSSLHAERYTYTWDLTETIDNIIRDCNPKILIRLLEYVHFMYEPHYMYSHIERAMMQACSAGYTDALIFMLKDERISRYITLYLYTSILKISSVRNQHAIVCILLKHFDRFGSESDYDICIGSALIYACSNSLETVRYFLEDSRTDPSYEHNAAISAACASGNPAIVRLLLDDERVDPTQKPARPYKEPIHAAQTYEIIKMLIDDGRVDLSSCNNQALIDAITSHIGGADRSIIRLLLADRRVVSAGLTPAIMTAKFYRCRSDVIDTLQAAQSKDEQPESENIETKSGSANDSL